MGERETRQPRAPTEVIRVLLEVPKTQLGRVQLRRLLKYGLRGCGIRCLGIETARAEDVEGLTEAKGGER